MASITSWVRLEPRCRDDDMVEGQRARLHDPLWLLARQWQVGEFRGEDAGSPVQARWRAQSAPLTRVHLGTIEPDTRTQAARYDVAAMPLEAMVERQPVDAGASLRRAVESGLQLLRLVDAQPTSRRYRAAFAKAFALRAPGADEAAATDPETLAWWRLAAGRAPDGRAMAAALRAPDGTRRPLPAALKVAPGDRAEIDAAVDRWLREEDQLFAQPEAAAPDAWRSDRMEYAFTVAGAHAPEGETALTATQYVGGRLDWHSVDVDRDVQLGAADDRAAHEIVQVVMPAPVSFRGMPAPRFWEFEDARLDWGLIDAGPGDLPQMLIGDFATSFGNDWYVIPVDVAVGTLTRTRSLVVMDSFGVLTQVRPINQPGLSPARGFSLFELDTVRRAGRAPLGPQPNLFLLAPAVGTLLEGRAVEEVMLMRDEMANLAWAIERAAPGGLEQRLDLEARTPSPAAPADTGAADGRLRFRLATEVPAHWIPLLPRRESADGPLRLVRAAVLSAGDPAPGTPRTALLRPPGGLALFDEEVPRAGARLTRSPQHARWLGGAGLLWMGLRNGSGRGEGASGLNFDQAAPT